MFFLTSYHGKKLHFAELIQKKNAAIHRRLQHMMIDSSLLGVKETAVLIAGVVRTLRG